VRTVARFDFFLDGDRLLFNEVNTMPGFTPTSLYAAMLEEWGIGRRELVSLLLRSAYAGHS
jgi:D-alanine-D-alanine ligase